MNFNEALEAFTKAACELSEAWEREDHTGDYYAAGYPFAKSFDETVHDIIAWRDKQRDAAE